MAKRQPTFGEALCTVVVLCTVIFFTVVLYDASPHIPMLIGCALASVVALRAGYRWEEIQQGMVEGVIQALEAMMILMLVGVLIGVWIEAGVVPSMIYYGLKLLSPRFFLVTAMLICSFISMVVGSWGTAGTIGLAFMGIAHAMGIPLGLAAGAIISGSYVGDKLSPLSDTTNLASAVTGVNVFDNVRRMFPVAGSVYLLAAGIFLCIGLQYQDHSGETLRSIDTLTGQLADQFWISPLGFLPLIILLACILLRLPSVPSIFIGILSAAVLGVLVQDTSVQQMMFASFSGHVSETGNEMLDQLLTAGGMESMMYSVSMILTAMMFGGIMEKTGQMSVLMAPLMKRIRSARSLIFVTLITCFSVNLILPEQYISIALPGRMYTEEYRRMGVDQRDLTVALGAGGAATSVLVPWNTCGVFMSGVLGVGSFAYLPFAFFNLLMPLAAVVYALVRYRHARYTATKSAA